MPPGPDGRGGFLSHFLKNTFVVPMSELMLYFCQIKTDAASVFY